jgi:hypothetical protein
MISTIERLDCAARAHVAEAVASRVRVAFTFVSVMTICLAVVSTASWRETMVVRALAVAVTLTTVTLWRRWRYSLCACGLVVCAVGVGTAMFGHYSQTFWGWTSRLTYPASFVFWGGWLWKVGRPLAAVQATGWEKERSQVQGWLSTLNNGDRAQEVMEVFSGSFWTGYFTYRLLNTGYCWVIAKFKKGAARRLVDFRIRELETVRVTGLDEKLMVEIANRQSEDPLSQCGKTRSGS